jgi:hypothetical protein
MVIVDWRRNAYSPPAEKIRFGPIPPQRIEDVLNTFKFGQIKRDF